MLEEIQSRLSELVGDDVIGDDKPWEDMYVCSACRPDKFSLHAVMGRLFVDRCFLSGPVVAYKVARLFSIRNVIWLLWSDDKRRWKNPRGPLLHQVSHDRRSSSIDTQIPLPKGHCYRRVRVFEETSYAHARMCQTGWFLASPSNSHPERCVATGHTSGSRRSISI